MREQHTQYLQCPSCTAALEVQRVDESRGDRIKNGLLRCLGCSRSYPVTAFIPRFVEDEGYTEGFGLEWTIHARTQYDRHTGVGLSERRFFEQTRWPRALDGEVIIEAGSGAGRFTEHALSTGAVVLSLDHSRAVEANYAANGHHLNALIVQGDLFRMPFPQGFADRLFCFGVLQHTPDPAGALAKLVAHLRPGGRLAADIYAKTFARYVLGTKYWVRPLTRRVPPERLYRWTSRYIDLVWPVVRLIRRIPKIGRALNWRLLVGDYSGFIEDDAVLREWAKLDTFDMLVPRYDQPARQKTIVRWCEQLGVGSVEVERNHHGFAFRARRMGGAQEPARPRSTRVRS